MVTNDSVRVKPRREITAEKVLDTFAAYQSKTVGMVAEELDISRGRAETLLTELEQRKDLTKARGSTETPVWLRRHPPSRPRWR